MKPPIKPIHIAPKAPVPKQFNKAAQMAKADQLRKPKAPVAPMPDEAEAGC